MARAFIHLTMFRLRLGGYDFQVDVGPDEDKHEWQKLLARNLKRVGFRSIGSFGIGMLDPLTC